MSEPARVEATLNQAGWADVAIEEISRPMHMAGETPQETAAFIRDTGMGKVLFTDVPPDVVERAMAAVTEALADRWGPDGLSLDSRAWLVKASRP